MEVSKASKQAIFNALKINPDAICSCYYCLSKYNGSEVDEYVDDGRTALCPVCGIDSVLPEDVDAEKLEEICEHYFKGE